MTTENVQNKTKNYKMLVTYINNTVYKNKNHSYIQVIMYKMLTTYNLRF